MIAQNFIFAKMENLYKSHVHQVNYLMMVTIKNAELKEMLIVGSEWMSKNTVMVKIGGGDK